MTTLAILALLVWLYLLLAHGRFWHSGPELAPARPTTAAPVTAVVPARDEAPVIAETLGSLLRQDYAGALRIIVVDDGSRDGTGNIARDLQEPPLPPAGEVGAERRERVVLDGKPRPPGWSGKLWALVQGIDEAGTGEFILLTDADIAHDPRHVATLVAQAERHDLDLVSEMVALACDTPAERALVPAFVYFFQLLYPFRWVNDPLRATAAAAGGTILIRQRALRRIGGIEAVRGALIDDVALATAVKRGGRVWLGHSALARSIRSYPSAADIWRMVSRTAYVQLGCSPLLLAGTVAGMALTFLAPPLAALFGHGAAGWLGWLTWGGMAASYQPTLHRYRRSVLWAPFLPIVAAFYAAATIGSAVNHYRGRGVAWKGRAYQGLGA
ncbi:MAG TPA: glycosyltransferase [Acetobacteraceae bacterium]|jgi:hopene-associated glycosyltransferase HpnB